MQVTFAVLADLAFRSEDGKSFGFEKWEGAKHTRYQHPLYPRLMATVPRHKSISPRYVSTALRLIREYEARRNEEREE